MARERSPNPSPFTYTVSSPEAYGSFIWDGSTGMAAYLQTGELVQRQLEFGDSIRFAERGQRYHYWRFVEAGRGDDSRKRKWLFEVPTEDQQFCAIYYYYVEHEKPTAFGDGLYRAIRPNGDQFVGRLR